MTLRHLKIFMQVYKDESITKAALNMGMAQPSVSIAVAELEEFYETKLFDRIGRRIQPTPAGETLAEYADDILNRFNASVQQIRGADIRKNLRVGMASNLAPVCLPQISHLYKQRCPDVEVTTYSYASAAVLDLLSRHKVELAIIDCGAPANLLAKKLCDDDYVLLCGRDFMGGLEGPLSREELARLDLILPSTPDSVHHPLADWLCSGQSEPHFVLRTASSHTMEAVTASCQAALPILRRLANYRIERNPSLKIVELEKNHPRLTFTLCMQKGKSVDPFIEEYIRTVEEVCSGKGAQQGEKK